MDHGRAGLVRHDAKFGAGDSHRVAWRHHFDRRLSHPAYAPVGADHREGASLLRTAVVVKTSAWKLARVLSRALAEDWPHDRPTEPWRSQPVSPRIRAERKSPRPKPVAVDRRRWSPARGRSGN